MASLSDLYTAHVESVAAEVEKEASAETKVEETTETDKVAEVDAETQEALEKFAEAEAAGRIAARAYVETLQAIFNEEKE